MKQATATQSRRCDLSSVQIICEGYVSRVSEHTVQSRAVVR